MRIFATFALLISVLGMKTAHAVSNDPSVSLPASLETSVIRETCGAKIESSSPGASAALTTMMSLQHVRHALAQATRTVKDPVYCVSALALSKNMYQYVQYYFQIDLHSGNETAPAFRFRFLFQNASVQAYHNVQGQPWTGLPPGKTSDVLSSLASSANFTPIENTEGTTDPVALAMKSKTFKASNGNIDAQTLSVLQLPTAHSSSDERPVYLVSWLSSSSTDPFAGFAINHGVLVSSDQEGRAWIAENVWATTQVLFPLSKMLEETMTALPVRDEWASTLVKMSSDKPL